MEKIIRLSKSCLSDLEKLAVRNVLDKEFLGMGEETQKFENQLSDFFGRETVCVNTGTSALQLALQSIGIRPGDEVLVQSLTFIASFQAISATGAIPIPCDINLDTISIDLDDAQSRITSRTKAIMPVHYAGQPGDLDRIYEFAQKNNLRVVEDAAHAFGSSYNNKKIGSFGDLVCFSFDGIKNITSGEGGCIVSSDKESMNRIKDLRLLGVEKDTEKRYSNERSWEFEVKEQGWRYHMSNIMAAIGIAQLERFHELSSKRQILSKLYLELFSGSDLVQPVLRDIQEIVPHIFPLILKKNVERKSLIQKLLEKKIQCGFHYLPNHYLSFYNRDYSLAKVESIFPRLLTLPLHPDLSQEDIHYIARTLLSELE